MTPATATFFPVRGRSSAQDRRAPKGSTRAPTTFKLQEYHETTCVSDQQTQLTTTRSKGCVWMYDPGAGDKHDDFPYLATSLAQKEDKLALEMRPRGAALTSPTEGVLQHMLHQELWRAVGTQYGPTRIYGPTGHAIGGTAQQALQSFYSR